MSASYILECQNFFIVSQSRPQSRAGVRIYSSIWEVDAPGDWGEKGVGDEASRDSEPLHALVWATAPRSLRGQSWALGRCAGTAQSISGGFARKNPHLGHPSEGAKDTFTCLLPPASHHLWPRCALGS